MRELLSTLIALIILIITSLAGALKASAKNDSGKDARIEAKVWFKDGRIASGRHVDFCPTLNRHPAIMQDNI